MGNRRRQPRRARRSFPFFLAGLVIGIIINRALVQAVESSKNETFDAPGESQTASLSSQPSPPTAALSASQLRGRFLNDSSVGSGRVVASTSSTSSSSSSNSISKSIVMDGDPCRTSYGHLCDPDKILTQDDVRRLIHELDDIPRSVSCEGTDVSVQLAVALVSKMEYHTDPSSAATVGDDGAELDVAIVAETYARSIHDKWGVGYETSCGGTGAVLFLAIEDRAMFISRGRALEKYLTDSRLDAILRDMRPMLRRQEYGAAVLRGIQEVFRYIESGEPSLWEKSQDYVWIAVLVLVFLIAYWSSKRDQERRRQYAQVTSQLSELDRAQAEVLRGKYQATSCPICLEAFPMAVESCSESSSSHSCGGGNGTTCGNTSIGEERLGSDGMPIKLLRCGHCFDDSCFDEWVRTGKGPVDLCPICKAPVGGVDGGAGGLTALTGVSESPQASPLRPRRTIGSSFDVNAFGDVSSPRRTQGGGTIRFQFDPVSTTLRMYNQERAFRLGRLQGRYPQFVGPREVQRWSDPSYEGSLARDPVVLNRDPFRANTSRGGTGASSASFGGGTSSGGRGGRW